MELIIALSIMTIISVSACVWATRDRRKWERKLSMKLNKKLNDHHEAKVIEMNELKMVEVDEKLTMHTLKQMQECQLN